MTAEAATICSFFKRSGLHDRWLGTSDDDVWRLCMPGPSPSAEPVISV